MGTVHRHELNAYLEDDVIEIIGFDDTDDEYDLGYDLDCYDEDYIDDWDLVDPIFYNFDEDIEPMDYGPYHYD